MAHVSEREPRLFAEKRETNKIPRKENPPADLLTDNYNKPLPRQDNNHYYKAKYSRKRKGKAAKSLPVKNVNETVTKETDNCVEESSIAASNTHEVALNAPEVKRDTCNGVVTPMKVVESFKGASVTPVKSASSTTAAAKPEVNRSIVENSELCREKIQLNQDQMAKEMSSCHLYDADAIFNELPYSDRLMLVTNYIEVPKKKSEKYPSAVFHCNICKFHCLSIANCRSHIKGSNHVYDLKERKLLESLRRIPAPTKAHIQALDTMVMETVNKFGMISSERDICIEVSKEVDSFVAENFPGCSLMLYGSVASRLALKESNIDLNLRTPPNLNGPTTLGAISKTISENPLFSDVKKDFDEGRPSIHFVHNRTNVKCSVCLCKEETLRTTEIITKYQTIDPRVRQLAVIFRKWAKLCKIDDYKNGMWPPHTFPILLIYYLQQCEPPVLPVLHELAGDPEDDTYLDPSELEGKWKQQNSMSLGELWLGLLRFYTVEYQHSEKVVCIRKKAPLKRSVKNWIGKRTAIEDPFCVKRNVSRTIIHNYSFRYIMNCFRLSFSYYAIPQCSGGSLYGYIQPPIVKLEKDPEHIKRIEELSRYWRSKVKSSKHFYSEDLPNSKKGRGIRRSSSMESSGDAPESSPAEFNPEKPSDENYVIGEEITEADAIFLSSRLKKESFVFDFVAETGNKPPPTICTICTMDGHTKRLCPDARLPPLPPLPPMTDQFCAKLDTFCHFVFDAYSQKPNDLKLRNEILAQLEEFIRGSYPDVQLSLFGSSSNGFGFRNSDLDICLTFKNNATGQGIDVTKLISKLVIKLRKMPTIKNIVPIPSAKVPIIKFKDIQTQLEGDISLYNTLAQHNTLLLKTYSCIDDRVKILGYVMKTFAKLCGICDASRGSLSSYAYILMVIYFLQQCDPPVLPVLQEVSDVQPKPVYMQEGQDVWFFKDLSKLKEVWPEYGKNNLSVGALWLQLLRFYTEDFNFEEYVVSIRQKQLVYKFEKLWFKKPMAIEDPFYVNHNLGGALSRKMKLFIEKSLRKGRSHFGTPISKLPPSVRSWEDYFLNDACLREGAPPNNGCHICKKIGHKVRNCPERGNYLKEKRQDMEHSKNVQGFVNQQQDQRRRMQTTFVNSSNFWAKGPPLVKDDIRHIPAVVPQHVRPMWYQQQWYPMRGQVGPHQMPWPHGVMPPNNRTSDMPPQLNPMPSPVPPPQDGMMPKVELPIKNHLFRSAELQGQPFHDPRIPLSNYRKQMNCEEKMKNNPGEPKALLSGAIPKVGQVNSPRPRYGKVKGAKNDNRQKP